MQARPDRPVTLEHLYELPDDGNRYELHRGYLVAEPAPGGRHGRIELALGSLLLAHARTHGCGVAMTNVGFVLARDPDTVRAPDIAYVDRERYDAVSDDARLLPMAPDLAVEVLSPSTRETQIRKKIRDYLDAGTRLVWIVDPAQRTVTTITPGTKSHVLSVSDVLSGAPVLADFAVPVAELFRDS